MSDDNILEIIFLQELTHEKLKIRQAVIIQTPSISLWQGIFSLSIEIRKRVESAASFLYLATTRAYPSSC